MWHLQAIVLLLAAPQNRGVFAPTLRNFATPYPDTFPCVLYLKNEEEKNKNKAFLPNEKEESQTLAKTLILFSNVHNKLSYLSLHCKRIQECKKGEKNSRCIAKTCNLDLTQALSTHILTRLNLARMPSQAEGSSLRSLLLHI